MPLGERKGNFPFGASLGKKYPEDTFRVHNPKSCGLCTLSVMLMEFYLAKVLYRKVTTCARVQF